MWVGNTSSLQLVLLGLTYFREDASRHFDDWNVWKKTEEGKEEACASKLV